MTEIVEWHPSGPTGRAHIAIEGPWICDTCGEQWPCGDAKRALVHEYAEAPTALYLYLSVCLYRALHHWSLVNADQPDADVFYARFMGWVHEYRTAEGLCH